MTLDLFDAPSKAGAVRSSAEQGHALAGTTAAKRYAILAYMAGRVESKTPDEISAALGWTEFAGRPRCSECVKAGWLADSGVRRKTAHGGTAAGLMLTGKGLAAFRRAGSVEALEVEYRTIRAERAA